MEKDEVVVNPFLIHFKGYIHEQHRVVDGLVVPKVFLKKKVDFVVYDASFFFGLSKSALNMLFWIFVNIERNEDEIRIKEGMFNISRSMFFKNIGELVDNAIISKARKDVYYININFFFKGSVIQKYPNLKSIIDKNTYGEEEKD